MLILIFFIHSEVPAEDTECGKVDLPKEGIVQRLIQDALFKISRGWRYSKVKERNPKIHDDYQFLEQQRYRLNNGNVFSEYVEEFQTRIYYNVTGKVDSEGNIPIVDPDSEGLVIYFHGTGTSKASGATFNTKSNPLSKKGFSVISFDLPFHKDGTRNPDFARHDVFLKYVYEIVDKYRLPGKPVVIAGHSGGAKIVGEFVNKYPHAVDGGLMVSLVAFNKELKAWFRDHTRPMLIDGKFGAVVPNELGGRWARLFFNKLKFLKNRNSKNPDPTLLNPDLKLRALWGENEEFIPGPVDSNGYPTAGPRKYDICGVMKKIFFGADCVLEPGVGHKLNRAKDRDGKDIVLREIEKIFGEDIVVKAAEKASKRKIDPTDLLAQRIKVDPFFTDWVLQDPKIAKIIEDAIKKRDNQIASTVMSRYQKLEQTREDLVIENMFRNKDLIQKIDPEFYDMLTSYSKKDLKDSQKRQLLFDAYIHTLEKIGPEEIGLFSVENDFLSRVLPLDLEKLKQDKIIAEVMPVINDVRAKVNKELKDISKFYKNLTINDKMSKTELEQFREKSIKYKQTIDRLRKDFLKSIDLAKEKLGPDHRIISGLEKTLKSIDNTQKTIDTHLQKME